MWKKLAGVLAILVGVGIAGAVIYAMVTGDGPRRGFRGILLGLGIAGAGAAWLFNLESDD